VEGRPSGRGQIVAYSSPCRRSTMKARATVLTWPSPPVTTAALPSCATYTIPLMLFCIVHHKSMTASPIGCEQQTRTLPSAGISSGSGP
jgi:hypothetical protein